MNHCWMHRIVNPNTNANANPNTNTNANPNPNVEVLKSMSFFEAQIEEIFEVFDCGKSDKFIDVKEFKVILYIEN